ncbi:MAG: MBL fold metallo-hydrolase [Candidatus Njordarchaeia archaeon]
MKSLRNKFIFLGTGDGSGIPVHLCDCDLCKLARENPQYARRQSTYLLNYKNKNIFFDLGAPEILRLPQISDLYIDAIFITHTHFDHTAGLFSLQWTRQRRLPIYYPEGTDFVDGFDRIVLNPSFLGPFEEIRPFKSVKVDDEIEVTPLMMNHSVYTFGYLIEGPSFSIAHMPTTKGLPEKTLSFLKKLELDLVTIDAMYPSKWELRDHNNLDEALEILSKLSFIRAFLVHLSHLHGSIEAIESKIDKHSRDFSGEVAIAFDGMAIDLKAPFKVTMRTIQ